MNLLQVVEELCEAFVPLARHLSEIKSKIITFVDENPDFIDNLKNYFENMPDIHSEIWQKGAENGWFVNWFTTIQFDSAVLSGKEELDLFMINHIKSNLTEIEAKLKELYPKRAKILETAFHLHRDKNYIASIPLFITQSDGICAQNLGAFLFTEHPKRGAKISDIIEEAPEEFEKIFWSPLTATTQFGAKIDKSKKKDKEKAPNRSGIMHGSRKHLDYGSEYNSLKCISLLAYTAFIFEHKKKA